ncbi:MULTISPECIES: ABC transporter substrate-binding protein [unclassified Aurantimonas]|uniref:ABC transporter substrate-binding protein n=1 Tax=unclassified Aurantimonas TaxID=2638230 RepID=UPI002E179D86|nr:ABC transporter substrate-binding protein [Aurantimonas sp. A3-2-R12]
MKRSSILRHTIGLAAAAIVAVSPMKAFAVGPEPEPLSPPVELTVGYQKVGHLAPITLISEDLKKLGVDLKTVEFARYADARTALLSGSLEMATVGPADLAIALSQGSTNIVGIMGVGSSPKYVIGREGVKLDSWEDLKGKTVAIAPGSAVWFQFAATLTEQGIPYDSFKAVNIQGGGANFDQALKRGEVDAIVTWEPFESVPVIEGYGYFAKGLEYSKSESVGAELGMVVATKEAVDNKREAVERFVWAYLKAQETLAADPKAFAAAYADLTGLAPDVAAEAAKPITLGSVVTPEQIARQAKAFAELGVIQRDVSAEIEDYWDASLVKSAKGE